MSRGKSPVSLYMVALIALAGCSGVTEPDSMALAGPWSSVSAGGAHTCALDIDGRASCWGANDRGQAGTGSTAAWVEAPTPIAAGDAAFVSISAGDRHTCAVDGEGAVWCWGANDTGQLGDGTYIDRDQPVAVTLNGRFEAVSAGAGHSCATGRDGVVVCWGENIHGQVGAGLATPDPLPPSAVQGPSRLVRLSAGEFHTCALASTGSTVCWGDNTEGALGTGALVDSPLPAAVAGQHDFRDVAAGGAHTCAIDLTGAGWCWGSNIHGEVAGEATTTVGTPAPRGTGGLTAIGAGESWTCALGTDGHVTCWGVRWNTSTDGVHPVDRAGWEPEAMVGKTAVRLSVGRRHACAVLDSGEISCWGEG